MYAEAELHGAYSRAMYSLADACEGRLMRCARVGALASHSHKRHRWSGTVTTVRSSCLILVLVLIAVASSAPLAGGAEVHVSVALECRCAHGHSPVWDAAMKRLHFVDIEGQRVLSYDPATNSHQEVDMLEQVGCVVPHVQNRLLVAGQECLYHLGFQVLSLLGLLVQKSTNNDT